LWIPKQNSTLLEKIKFNLKYLHVFIKFNNIWYMSTHGKV